MDKLRKLFKGKNKNINTNLAVVAAIGVILLVISGNFFGNKPKDIPLVVDELTQSSVESLKEVPNTHEGILEARLEEAFKQVEGVGDVKVMLTLTHGKEVIIAEDIKSSESSTNETDSSGGVRQVTNTSLDSNKIIMSNPGGGNQPLILKEMEPQVEGVIIIAEGGDNVFVREALINASRTVLGIEAHKVQVLKMATQNN